MSPLPDFRPKQLSLGPLEAEILEMIWELGSATVKDIHDRILADPDRELAYASVTTVLRRLTDKGWLICDKGDAKERSVLEGNRQRAFVWRSLISRDEAKILKSHDQLRQFLRVSNPDIVAAFADELDRSSLDQLEAIAQRLKAARQAREER